VEVVPVKSDHRQVLRSQWIAPAIRCVSEAALAKSIGDAAALAKFATQFHHRVRVTAESEMPEYRHSMTVLILVSNTPVARPQVVTLAHSNRMPSRASDCNRISEQLRGTVVLSVC
jgi:hypothetical protein